MRMGMMRKMTGMIRMGLVLMMMGIMAMMGMMIMMVKMGMTKMMMGIVVMFLPF